MLILPEALPVEDHHHHEIELLHVAETTTLMLNTLEPARAIVLVARLEMDHTDLSANGKMTAGIQTAEIETCPVIAETSAEEMR